MLGERLYMLIVPTQPQLAGKITDMLLEALNTAELLGLIHSPLRVPAGEVMIRLMDMRVLQT